MGVTEVLVSVREYDGSPHWHHSAVRLGEDEFAVHQVLYSYPAEVVARATASARSPRAAGAVRERPPLLARHGRPVR